VQVSKITAGVKDPSKSYSRSTAGMARAGQGDFV
jgi:hypothetical protein